MKTNWSLRGALALASSMLLLASLPAHAQSSFATRPRVSGRVEDSARTLIQGNVSRVLHSALDQGEAGAGEQITHMRLVLTRSDEQKAAFESYLAQLQDKKSPNYHKWLTPQQVGQLYGPAESDISAATAWLQSHGLQVEPIAPFHTDIPFSGTVAQVEAAFQTRIHAFVRNGERFYANTTAPTIPTALRPVVTGVAHLNTMKPRSFAHPGAPGIYDSASKRNIADPNAAAAKAISKSRANDISGSGYLYLVPGDLATIYNTPNSTLNANFAGGSSYDGTGVTIGVGGDSSIVIPTIQNYRSRYLGLTNTSNILNLPYDAVTSNSDEVEAYLDMEVSGGIAPGATLRFYPSTDLTSGVEQAIADNKVDIFNLSFGNCEFFMTTADNANWYSLWQTAAAQGIAVTVSTGDSGSAGCDYPTDSTGHPVTAADYGLHVNGLGSTPYNIAVGGTDLVGLLTDFTTYAPTTDASNYYRSAVSYIPESTWNDSSPVNGKLAQNTVWNNPNDSIVAGSGGQSDCAVNTDTEDTQYIYLGTCTGGYAKPAWQRGAGVPADNVRDLPDLSLMAGDGFDLGLYLVCADYTYNSNVYNCNAASGSTIRFIGVGGTSAAAPAFAGVLALIQQKTGGRLGQAAVELYDLYNNSHGSAIFHDITEGNNSVPCDVGTANCSLNTAGYYFETSYDAGAGYDFTTGIGSVDVTSLVTYWAAATSVTPTVTATPSKTSIAATDAITVAASVTGSATDLAGDTVSPTGTVTLTAGSYSSGAKAIDASGNYTFTVPAGTLTTAGTNTLTVTYSGDANFQGSTATTTVTLLVPTAVLSPTSLSFATTPGTASAAQTITLTNSGGASLAISGIALGGASASPFSQTNNCGSAVAAGASCAISVTFSPVGIGTANATLSVTDNASGSPQSATLTGTSGEPSGASYTITAAPVTIASAGASGTSAITATGANGYVGPGTVAISACTLATSPTGAVHAPTCAITTGTVTFASGSGSGTGGVLTISTTAATTSNAHKATARTMPGGTGARGGMIAVSALVGLLLLLPGRARRWRSLLGAFLLVAAIGVLSGCGGGSSSSGGGGTTNPGTTAGSYTFTVTGKDSITGNTQTATLNLTVQ